MDPQKLLQALPHARDWVERTLGAHRAETRPTASYHFPRLAQFFTPIFLETCFVVVVSRVPVPPLSSFGLPELAEFENGNYAGITYRNTYFIREDSWSNESIHFHELVHVIQWQHLGVDGFLTAYATGLLQHGYRNNPLEAMAHELQEHFDRGGERMDVKSVVRSRLKTMPGNE
jgi:hypothetical protein